MKYLSTLEKSHYYQVMPVLYAINREKLFCKDDCPLWTVKFLEELSSNGFLLRFEEKGNIVYTIPRSLFFELESMCIAIKNSLPDD